MAMEPLAAAGISILTAFLAKAGQPLAEKAGSAVADAAGSLLEAVRKKFKGDAYAEQSLKRLEDKPAAPDRQAAVQGVLSEKIEQDAGFAAELKKLAEAVRRADRNNVIARGDRSVAIGGNAQGNVIITGDENQVQR